MASQELRDSFMYGKKASGTPVVLSGVNTHLVSFMSETMSIFCSELIFVGSQP